MGGINPAVITHKLIISPSFKPIKQKRRSFTPERQKAINEEVNKLLQAKAIREVEYPNWLANVVLIKKANGKWRLYIDFTDVNRACPKDSFPLPWIDLIVDATVGHELLSFMDAFSGYNQIKMDPIDQEKTSFVTGQGTYCYQVMPFGLKNAGATYQRLVNKMFQKHIGASMEVYIDDMLVKSIKSELHVAYLAESFQVLKNYNMKLNPTHAPNMLMSLCICNANVTANYHVTCMMHTTWNILINRTSCQVPCNIYRKHKSSIHFMPIFIDIVASCILAFINT